MQNRSYTYVYCDPRKPGIWKTDIFTFFFEPFYVGEGVGKRMFAHVKSFNSTHKSNKIKQMLSLGVEPYFFKIAENLSGDDALALETALIKQLGTLSRIDDVPCGPLTNEKINRGEKKVVMSDAAKQKLSAALKGQPKSEEHRAKISAALKGKSTKKPSDEVRAKMSASHTGKKRPGNGPKLGNENGGKLFTLEFEDGSQITIKNVSKWCRDNDVSKVTLASRSKRGNFFKGVRIVK